MTFIPIVYLSIPFDQYYIIILLCNVYVHIVPCIVQVHYMYYTSHTRPEFTGDRLYRLVAKDQLMMTKLFSLRLRERHHSIFLSANLSACITMH